MLDFGLQVNARELVQTRREIIDALNQASVASRTKSDKSRN